MRLPLVTLPAPAPESPSERSALLNDPFRPLYLAGTAWAAVVAAVWVFAPHLLGGRLTGVAWHAHEMLWGFVATIAVGFLLTAGTSWTGIRPMSRRTLGVLCGLWLGARTGFLIPGPAAFWVAALAEVLLFLLAAAAMGRAVFISRNARNYGVPFLIAALGATDLAFLGAVWSGRDYAELMFRLHVGLQCMALIALLISRRVIPFFAMRARPGLVIPPHVRTGMLQVAAAVISIIAFMTAFRTLHVVALGVAGAIALWQVVAWQPNSVRAHPLLWILYLGYAGLGVGLLARAAQVAGVPMPRVLPVHLIAMGGFSVLIIGMVTRTALGHLGRRMSLDGSMRWSYWLIVVATALRLGALWQAAWAVHLLHLSAAAWIVAFLMYLWRFAPWMFRHTPTA
ncbi:MAG: NnrS family protein [Gemmatimonadaceae bacterium]|nr:NnrS family protein [Gemmatimonadaceae bacterium]